MSTLQIEERITVAAPPARVWKFLLDPARVAACLPGAKLDGTEGEDTFLGTMKVKVGPVVMEIKGKATMSHIDPVGRKVTLTGTGNDKAGGGSARMDMKSEILALDDGGSEILVHAEVHLAGKLVRFGRGMMEGISKQLFKQFAERVHGALDDSDDEEEEEEKEGVEESTAPPAEAKTTVNAAPEEADKAPPTEAEKAPPAEPDKAPPAEPDKAPPTEADKAPPTEAEKAPPTEPEGQSARTEEPPPAAPEAPAPAAREEQPSPARPDTDLREAAVSAPAASEPKDEPSESPAPEEAPSKADADSPPAESAAPATTKSAAPATAALAPRKKKPTKKPVVAPEDNAPLDAGSLVWSAIWAWIKGVFARVFGRKS